MCITLRLFAVPFLILGLMGSAAGQAVEDLTWSQEPTTGRWYALRLEDYGNFQPQPDRIPYPEALDFCRAMSGTLPTAQNEPEAIWLWQTYGQLLGGSPYPIWLGLRGIKDSLSGGNWELSRFWESSDPFVLGNWADSITQSIQFWQWEDKLYGTFLHSPGFLTITAWPDNVTKPYWEDHFQGRSRGGTVCELWCSNHPLTDSDGDGVLDVYEDANHDGVIETWESDPFDPNDAASYALYVRRFSPGDAPFFIIRNGTPNGILYPLFSLTGPGPHNVGLGTMMDLSPPIGQLPSIVLDAVGRGEGARGALPDSAPFGLPVWIQGLELSFNSNGFEFNVTNSLFIQVGAI